MLVVIAQSVPSWEASLLQRFWLRFPYFMTVLCSIFAAQKYRAHEARIADEILRMRSV